MVTEVDWNTISFIRQLFTPEYASNPRHYVWNLHYSNNMLHTEAVLVSAHGQHVLWGCSRSGSHSLDLISLSLCCNTQPGKAYCRYHKNTRRKNEKSDLGVDSSFLVWLTQKVESHRSLKSSWTVVYMPRCSIKKQYFCNLQKCSFFVNYKKTTKTWSAVIFDTMHTPMHIHHNLQNNNMHLVFRVESSSTNYVSP